MLKGLLLISGLLSLLYFLSPNSFPQKESYEKLLGITQAAQVANAETVKNAVTLYCLDNGQLPENLNILYEKELSKTNYLDLDKNYSIQGSSDCSFQIKAK